MSKKAIFYIDGFNFYFGLCDAIKFQNYKNYKWLDYQLLSENILKKVKPDHNLELVKYFTANIRGDAEKVKRQNTYLDALLTKEKIRIYKGLYQIKKSFDKNLKQFVCYPVEKRTDVNIATQILIDAHLNNFDTAFLVTGDSDLIPVIEAIRANFPSITIVICFPPLRSRHQELKSIAQIQFHIKEWILKKSLLNEKVYKTDGTELKCPEKWKFILTKI